MPKIELTYEQGTLLYRCLDGDVGDVPGFVRDGRTLQNRAPARLYREFMLLCERNGWEVDDQARRYEKIQVAMQQPLVPRAHQAAALNAWEANGYMGVVSLPTGAGKTILAVLAIAKVGRPTLVVVPTIDLMVQWMDVLNKALGLTIGQMGGGTRDIQDITVATYDTARLMLEGIGNRFGLLVIDECHHLPAQANQMIGLCTIAPFRLGLSATVERADGAEETAYALLGPMIYHGQIGDLVSTVLAPYDVVSVEVDLTEEERGQYDRQRQIYVDFLRSQRIDLSQSDGWRQFIMRSAQSSSGREAMAAYREQKKLAQSATAKLDHIWTLLNAHPTDSTIIFTEDNEMAYRIGRTFVLAVLTHRTKAKERQRFLSTFRDGTLKVLVTSKVLNEGVDVPCATVGIVVSGSGAVREHVQRLGRILRQVPGKRAVLYEIITRNSNEANVHHRRKQHSAYQKPAAIYAQKRPNFS